MRKIIFIAITTICLCSCKKSAPDNKIQVISYADTQDGYINVHVILYDEAARNHIADLSDSVTVALSVPLNSGTVLDTLVIPPYANDASNTIGPGVISGQLNCTILNATSKGQYIFNF